ncbi:hypothetical protein H6504_00990 [Candidatus Woesearchaeota archaeon]|nr:hypothetical protein [Candidatus Woesearchaeota archaeon]
MIEKDLTLKIVTLYVQNYMDLFSINKIATLLDLHYPYVHKTVNEMVDREELRMIPVGRSHLCALNLEHPVVVSMLAYAHALLAKRYAASTTSFLLQKNDIIDAGARAVMLQLSTPSKLYAVTESKLRATGVHAVNPDELRGLLSQASFFRKHAVLFGIEYFINHINRNKDVYNRIYNPLLEVLL